MAGRADEHNALQFPHPFLLAGKLRRSSDTYRRPSPSPFSASQSLSLVVPVGGSPDVNSPPMRPTTSSRVSAMSRISRPTSPVKARPTRGGVCGNHLRTSIEEASRRSRASKDKVSARSSAPCSFRSKTHLGERHRAQMCASRREASR